MLEVVKTDVLGEDEEDSIEGEFDGLEEKPVPVSRICRLPKILCVGILVTRRLSLTLL